MKVLGIETSCDETSVAVVVDGKRVLSNVVSSQIPLHRKFEGVVPEIASRAHIENLNWVVSESLSDAGMSLSGIEAVAVSTRPGLVGCLLIGHTAAKSLSWLLHKPLIAVNHVHAHATSAAIELDHDPWPAVALVVSGGHTSLYLVRDYDHIELMGSTTDDACGEAFDKVASILKLGYPGGPVIDRVAAKGNPDAIAFPRSLLDRDSLDFSYSGLKTAVLYHVHGPGKTRGGLDRITQEEIADIAASFQAAAVDVLVEKTLRAVHKAGVRTVVAGGGVVANSRLRARMTEASRREGFELHLASMRYCTDNAAMIAAHGHQLLKRGHRSGLEEDVSSAERNERIYSASTS